MPPGKSSMGGFVWFIVILLIVGGAIGGFYYATNGDVLKWFTPPSVTSFDASPKSITSGGTATLNWAVMGAQSVSISPDIGTVSSSGSQAVNPDKTTEYTLTASNLSGSSRAWATVTVTAPSKPAISSFSSNPGTITAGQSATLSWNVTGATSVSISPAVGNVSSSGSKTVTPTETTSYTITAVNDAGSSTTTAKVTVNPSGPPTIASFTASPASITSGGSSTLSWTVSGATSVTINQGVGTVSTSGTRSVSPSTTTTYTLTAGNSLGSSTATAAVTVTAAGIPVITIFTASPSPITAGDNMTLSWTVTGATTINILPGVGTVSATGTRTLIPAATTTYTLTATNTNGPATATATVTVASEGPPVISSFYPSPVTVTSGSSSTLHWTVADATEVSITPGIGVVSATGLETVTPLSTTTYVLTAFNSHGTITATTAVTVAPAGYPAISFFNAVPASVASGQSTTLSWTVTGASTVSINQGIGAVSASGSRTITPAATTTYTITATNGSGSVAASATVTVTTTSGTPPVIDSFGASPTTISPGGSSLLNWSITGATSISIEPDIGEPSSWGYQDVYPTETTTYTLTAFNSAGSDTATVTVTVTP
ncbi:MAG: hypothetical protein WC169_09075 [Dehalococcoidia bacterium]